MKESTLVFIFLFFNSIVMYVQGLSTGIEDVEGLDLRGIIIKLKRLMDDSEDEVELGVLGFNLRVLNATSS